MKQTPPKLSIIVPSHDPKWLGPLFSSVLSQDFQDWELVLVLTGQNTKCEVPNDPRIKVFTGNHLPMKVGAAKAFGFSKAVGTFLLELDHDDCLVEGILSKVVKSFEDSGRGFLFTNSAQYVDPSSAPFTWTYPDGTKRVFSANEDFLPAWPGGKREHTIGGVSYKENVSLEVHPANLIRIDWAPDHLRAWRRDVYFKVGGHSPDMAVLDDLDLMCRTYLETDFFHLDELGYLYRVHSKNTWHQSKEWGNLRAEIYNKYFEKLCLKWSDRKGLQVGELWPEGGAPPYSPGSYGFIKAYDSLHLRSDKQKVMGDLHSALAPSGVVMTFTPDGRHAGGMCDPRTKSQWVERSFEYWTNKSRALFINNKQMFKVVRSCTEFPNKDYEKQDLLYVTWDGVKV